MPHVKLVKITIKDFIDKHPSLKGKIEFILQDDFIGCRIEDIDKTQLDRKVVKEKIIEFNSTEGVWLDPLIAEKAFRLLLKGVEYRVQD